MQNQKRHVAGYSMSILMINGDILEREDISPLEKLILAYDQQNETPYTSDESCAFSLGVTAEQITVARNHLDELGESVEPHRETDLTEEEYYV